MKKSKRLLALTLAVATLATMAAAAGLKTPLLPQRRKLRRHQKLLLLPPKPLPRTNRPAANSIT